MDWIRKSIIISSAAAMLVVGLVSFAAAQSTSTDYRVDEYFFGNGGELQACSTSYCAKQSAGETTVGNSKSAAYQSQSGFNTTQDPMLEVAVNGNVSFGILDPSSTKYGTANVQVRTYLASGYNMIIAGAAPTSGSLVLSPIAFPTTSQTGTTQFGINLRANTTPNFGADPVQVPATDFSFGSPTGDYNTTNTYKYTDGDVVAYSNSSSGQTNFTLAMIANISAVTAAGFYQTNLSVVVVSSF